MINRGLLAELVKNHDINNIERHLFYIFIENNKVNYAQSSILSQYFESFEKDFNLYFSLSSLSFNQIKDLEKYLELLIPINDRRLNGAYFTPDYIIDFIIKELQPKIESKNLDPSCGCGAFLIGLAEYYKSVFKKPIKQIIKDNIWGVDILPYNVRRAKLILAIYALLDGEILEENDFNIVCEDALEKRWDDSFDNIVGNPPYVKLQDLTEKSKQSLTKNWSTIQSGSFNLYFAFFELGYNLLSPEGKLGFITPNSYFTSLAGRSLRSFFHLHKCVVRIIDFSFKRIFDAQTYTAITFLSKKQNDVILYDRIKSEVSPENFLPLANGSVNCLKNLSFKKWRLLKSNEQNNIHLIETIGIPIGKMFDISVGIATLKDDVFFLDGNKLEGDFFIKKTKNGIFKIEKSVAKPIYKISDFKTQDDLNQNQRKIIFPYVINNGTATIINEADFASKFPHCYEYLLSEKTALAAREKGKLLLSPFYSWGRNQGITKVGVKLLNPTFSRFPRFLIAKEEDSYFSNGYGIFFKKGTLVNHPLSKVENIDILQKVLNSDVMHYYISKTSVSIDGGYPCYQKNFIEKFSIPEMTDSEVAQLKNLDSNIDINNFLVEKYQINLPAPNLLL